MKHPQEPRPTADPGSAEPSTLHPARPTQAPAATAPSARLSAWLQGHWWRPQASWVARWLQPLSWVYQALAALDRARQRRQARRLPVPVCVVGNLIVGGAGKTPTVIALVQALQARGWHPGVVSRGYGRQGEGVVQVSRQTSAATCGDEPLLIHLRTGAPVTVGSDRVAAGLALLKAHPEVNLLLADDGLQHLRLARDRQVIVFDGRGAGNGLALPAGPLRQRLPSRVPPHSQVLYNADAASTALPGAVAQRRLAGLVRLDDWWAGRPAEPAAWTCLTGRVVWAAAGLAQPERFFRMLEQQGLALRRLPLPDHAALDPPPWLQADVDVVVTEKDSVKLRPGAQGTARVWVAALDLHLPPVFLDDLLCGLPAPGGPVPFSPTLDRPHHDG